MTTAAQERTPQEIWSQLDAEDAGTATAEVTAEPEKKEEKTEVVDLKTEEKVEKTDAATEKAIPPDPLADWQGVPDVVKKHFSDYADNFKRIDERLASLAQIEEQAKAAIGRVSNLQQELVKIGRQVAATTKSAPSAIQISDAVEDPAEWKQLQSDFPDWAVGIRKFFDSRLASAKFPVPQAPDLEALRAEFAPMKEEFARFRSQEGLITALQKSNEAMREYIVELQHPGWKDDVKSESFKKWFVVQPPEIRSLGGSENPMDAIRVLGLYKHRPDPTKIAEQRKERLAQASEVKGIGASAPTKKWEEMSPEEQWNEMDRQAKLKGETY